MNQSGKNILVLSSDEDLDLGCSFQMKDSIYSDALNLTHSDGVDDAFVPPVKIGLDNDKITGEPAVSQTQRYGLYFNYILFHCSVERSFETSYGHWKYKPLPTFLQSSKHVHSLHIIHTFHCSSQVY